MNLKTLVDKTLARQQILLGMLAVPGLILLVVGLVTGVGGVFGLGVAFVFASGVTFITLRRKKAALYALIDAPERVVQVVPIKQVIRGGMVTNFPVVLVADDGSAHRIATFASSVEQAVAPFRAHFPHANGADPDSVFAPDDGFGARLKGIGLMLGSLLVGLLGAVLFVTPSVSRKLAGYEEAGALQKRRNDAEKRALQAFNGGEIDGVWSSCAVPAIPDSFQVILSGAVERNRDRKRDGWIIEGSDLLLDEEEPFYGSPSDRSRRFDETLDALMRGRHSGEFEAPKNEKAWAVLGVRRDDVLSLRIVDLDADGKVLCEGTTRVSPHEKGSAYSENQRLAEAVKRPFCAHLKRTACEGLAPELVAAAPVAEKAAPLSAAGLPSPTKDSIRSTVQATSARTRSCYEQGLRKNPKLSGKLMVAFVIGRDGTIASAEGSGFPDAAVTSCVVKEFKGLRFGPTADGKPISIRYPLVFARN